MTDQITTTKPVRGRPLAPGNGGRRTGSLNRRTVILKALLDGEEEELIRKGLELARAGNVTLLKYFYDRLLPRERLITIELPKMETADDAVEALGVITSAVCEGKITPGEAASLAALINANVRAIENADLVKRIEAIETRMSGSA